MNNWPYNFRNWTLSKNKKYYIITEDKFGSFVKGDKVIVICHGHGNFDVLPYAEIISFPAK